MNYLDHAATSPLHPRVQAAMAPWWGVPANPSSAHRYGQRARMALERAREQVAALVDGHPSGVVFTSGATEANHLFVRGIVHGGGAIAISAVEHPSVRAAAAASGAAVHVVPVDAGGRARLDAVPEGVAALSLMAVNHETGVVQPFAEARLLAERRGFALHVDATQAAGRVALGLSGVHGASLSAHKLGGPVGVGALVLRDGSAFPALFAGAQERGRRAGTPNIAGIVGFAEACAMALSRPADDAARIAALAGRLRDGVRSLGGRVVGEGAVAEITAAVFPGLPGELLVQALDLEGIAVSAGAACASGGSGDSPVLAAMGDPEPAGIVRFSLGWSSTEGDVDAVLARLPVVLARCRAALHALAGG